MPERIRIRERPDLHKTISNNLRRRYIEYLNHPEYLQTEGGMKFMEMLRDHYPRAHDKLAACLPEGHTVF